MPDDTRRCPRSSRVESRRLTCAFAMPHEPVSLHELESVRDRLLRREEEIARGRVPPPVRVVVLPFVAHRAPKTKGVEEAKRRVTPVREMENSARFVHSRHDPCFDQTRPRVFADVPVSWST